MSDESGDDSAPGTPESPLETVRYFGDYELLEQIGRGGMGVVYKARQISLNRTVALKMIASGEFASPSAVQRFHIEAEAAAKLDYPHIVPIYEIGVHRGQHYFSMKYVQGRSLAEEIRSGKFHFTTGENPPSRAAERERQSAVARLMTAVAHSVHYAHQHGVLHRDLKPGNILVDAEGQPHLTDFGLAKILELELGITQSAETIGTPSYMSPEQAEGRQLTTTTDIYSLGAILYELLTGRPPFRGATAMEVLQKLIAQEPAPLQSQNRLIDRDLATVCLKALQKHSQHRYTAAEAFADELERWVAGEPIRARPANRPERVWRWCRRNPTIASLGGATIVLLFAVAIGSPIAALHIDRERQRAEKGELAARQKAYASDMNLAQQAVRVNNIGKARRLLDRHRPQPGEEDLRGWEWRYLWQLTRNSALVTLTNRPTRGFSVSFSPDGTRLAVGWIDGQVDLWDIPGRRRIRALMDRAYAHPARVAFSPVRNILAATSEPTVVKLYHLDSGLESILWRVPDQGKWEIHDLSFSPDGSRMIIYAGSTLELDDKVWVIDMSSSQVESHHSTDHSATLLHGAARLSPDNQRLYLSRSDALRTRYSIQCLDLVTGRETWQTEMQRDQGLTALAVSPDGRVLVSGSGFDDPNIRVWDAATGRLLARLDGHSGWVCKLAFTKDGRRLISAATDQSIRFWDTGNWAETGVLRGHTDEVFGLAISEAAQLLASAGKDGNLILWKDDGKSAADGYSRLPENLGDHQVRLLDRSRVVLLPPDRPPEIIDLKHDSAAVPLPWIGSSSNVLGCFGTNLLCHWNGTNQIIVRELRGAEFIQRGAIRLGTGSRPLGLSYNPTRQFLAWTEGTSSASVFIETLAGPSQRIELRSDVARNTPRHFSERSNHSATATYPERYAAFLRFSEDGNYLAAITTGWDSLRAWNVDSRQIVVSIDGFIAHAAFAAGGRVLIVTAPKDTDHEIQFYDLAHPDREPRRVHRSDNASLLAVSHDGRLVASSTQGGKLEFFDPALGKLVESLHGHLNGVHGIAFSADDRRLISTSGGRETVKLWDVGTRQELLTLGGTGSMLDTASWSADGDVILAGPPWQAWRAPSWEEIASAEAKGKTGTK